MRSFAGDKLSAMTRYDAIVIGLGAMGAAACDQLAARGCRVLGIEQFLPAHDRGSSHGETRIIRKAYFEHADYVPLLHRAYAMWDELSADASRTLFERVGLLLMGVPKGEVIVGVQRAAREHHLAIEEMPPAEVAWRFPGFRPDPSMVALFEPDAGFLHVEACIRAMLDRAKQRGAELKFETAVTSWAADGTGVRVMASRETYFADRLVVTAGPWAGKLLTLLARPLEVLRKVQLWFPASGGYRVADRSPVFCVDTGPQFFYGAPVVAGDMMKVAEHSGREVVSDPGMVDRSLRAEDVSHVVDFVRRVLPGLTPVPARHAVCLYTMTLDGHFVIDRHPEFPQVALAAGFSGHGFKFAPIVGSILADLTLSGRTAEPAGFLKLGRAGMSLD